MSNRFLDQVACATQVDLGNALTTNQRALQILRSYSLHQLGSDDTWPDPKSSADATYLAQQLHEPHARAMAAELIKCALPHDVTLNYSDPVDHQQYRWQGELGLCRAPGTGNWLDDRPTVGGVGLTLAILAERMPSIAKLAIERVWAGLLPQTPDALPILGPVPGLDGLPRFLSLQHAGGHP